MSRRKIIEITYGDPSESHKVNFEIDINAPNADDIVKRILSTGGRVPAARQREASHPELVNNRVSRMRAQFKVHKSQKRKRNKKSKKSKKKKKKKSKRNKK